MPGTDDLMAGYSNSIGGLMADHNSMVSGLMANYNAGGGSGGGIMAGPAFTPGPGVSYGPGPMNNTGRWTPNGLPGSSWDNPFAGTPWEGMLQPPMQPMGQEFEQGGDAPSQPPRRKIRGYSNPAARSTKVPFGGFRAKGGPVSPGRKYVVGERGAEMFVPDRPGTIVPINPLDRHVNRLNARGDKQLTDNADHYSGLEKDYAGMAKDYQGMMLSYQERRDQHKPGTPEYEAANKSQNEMYDQFVDKVQTQEQYARDAAKNRGLIGTGQGWKDHVATDEWSQRRAEAAMEAMRERSMATPGSPRFTGPVMPPPGGGKPNMRLIEAQKQNAIAGQNQRDLDAKFGAQPQGMRSIDAAFTDNSLSGRASARDGAVRTGSLSERGPTPVGRSANNPQRIAEQMRRRGDPRAIMQMGMQQQGMDFARERDANNFQQQQQRDATNHAQGMQMWNLDRSFQMDAEGRRNQAALDAEGRRNQRGDAEWTRGRAAELEDRKNSAIDAPFTMTDPSGKFVIPGVKTRGGDFKPMGGAYPVKEANAGPTPAEVNQMRQDADTRGYDMVQLPSGEWKLQRKLQPSDQGSETTVYDADGKPTQRTVRTPRGGSAGSKGTGYW